MTIERILPECMASAKTLAARLPGHDDQEVIPAKAGIQNPYVQLQTALGKRTIHASEGGITMLKRLLRFRHVF